MSRPYNSARIPIVVAMAAACGIDPAIEGIVVRVEVAPATDSVVVGQSSSRLTATAFNANDDPVADVPFVWRSDQPFLAAVDSQTGAVAGLAVGIAAVTASVGLISDTAEVFVLAPVGVSFQADTLILAAGDTMTMPVTIEDRVGASPTPSFAIADPAIATVDPATGLVTAVSNGITGITVTVDTFQASGGIAVLAIQDTLVGFVYMGMAGGLSQQMQLNSRAFNHPTDDSRSVFNLNALSARNDQFGMLLLQNVTAPVTLSIPALPGSALAPGNDIVCFPPSAWTLYRDTRTFTLSLSLDGGSVSITQVHPLTGGSWISGRFSVMLERDDRVGEADGRITAVGTFAIPVVALSSCPKGAADYREAPVPLTMYSARTSARKAAAATR